jgi:hypothetical protein
MALPFQERKKDDVEAPIEMRGSPGAWSFLGALILSGHFGFGLTRGRTWYGALLPVRSPDGQLSTPDNVLLLLGFCLLVLGIGLKIREILAAREDD